MLLLGKDKPRCVYCREVIDMVSEIRVDGNRFLHKDCYPKWFKSRQRLKMLCKNDCEDCPGSLEACYIKEYGKVDK